jgi:ketosteroid isomerase-like protein
MSGADEEKTGTADSEVERQLRSANQEWVRAVSQRDGAALHRIMADEFELAYPFEGDDKDQFIAAVINGDIRVESLEAHSLTMRVSSGTGLVFGSETANWYFRNRNLSGTYRVIRVYTRQDGKWRIVMLHLCAPHR